MTFYYDPVLDYHHEAPLAVAGLLPSFYLSPQNGHDARALYDGAVEQLELDRSGATAKLLGPRMTAMTIALSREFGETHVADALLEAADEEYEPTWDRERGEFTWGFGLRESHPRGQYNALMAAAEAMSEGAWTRLFNDPHQERFAEPTVVGVDFPDLTLRQAWWDRERDRLTLATSARNGPVPGRRTSFRIANLAKAANWKLEIDGASSAVQRVSNGDLVVELSIGSHRVEVFA